MGAFELMLANVTQNDSVVPAVEYALMSLVPQWSRSVFTGFMIIVLIIGLPGNTLVMIVQSKISRKNATDWFVTFLALCDILSILVCLPVFLLGSTGLWVRAGSSFWCKFHFFNLYVCFVGSVLIIDCLCIERYSKTMKSVNMKFVFSPNLALAAGATSLIVGAVIGSTAFLTTKNNSVGECRYDPAWHYVQIYVHGIILLIVIVSCLLIAVVYSKIIMLFRKSCRVTPICHMTSSKEFELMRQHRLRRMTLKTTKIIGLVTTVFVFSSCLPVIAVLPLSTPSFVSTEYGRVLLFFLTRIYMLNNFMNPVFYLWMYPAFRKKAWTLFVENCRSSS